MSNQKRHEAGAPASKGGEFKAQQRPDAEVAITAPRKPGTLGGYELKNFKKLNIGNEGGAFTASLYRDGKKVLLVENGGTGGENVFRPATGGYGESFRAAQQELTALVKKVYGDGGSNTDLFISLLDYSSQIDKMAAKSGWTREEVVEANIKANAAAAGDYPWVKRENEILRHPEILDALRAQA